MSITLPTFIRKNTAVVVLPFTMFGCLTGPVENVESTGPFHSGNPAITAIDFSCDGDEGQWSIEVTTDAWTSGGTLWMGPIVEEREKHKVESKSAARDGSWDELDLTLDQEADWRDQSNGSSSRWLCDDMDRLSFLFVVKKSGSSEVSDCRIWGASPDMWSQNESLPKCETLLIVPTENNDTGSSEARTESRWGKL